MEIVYQPVIDLSTDEIHGYEALARFPGTQTPDDVFREAWERGSGVDLEVSAFEMAIRNFPHDIDETYLAINASARTIIATRGQLVADLGLEIPWPRIIVEISEKQEIIDYPQMNRLLAVMRQNKARVALDDIGAPGYSGFGVLLQIEPDILKIDRSLISCLDVNSTKRAIVSGIVAIGNGLRSKVVAEGIETEAEKQWCTSLGVDYGQGYHLGMPKAFEN